MVYDSQIELVSLFVFNQPILQFDYHSAQTLISHSLLKLIGIDRLLNILLRVLLVDWLPYLVLFRFDLFCLLVVSHIRLIIIIAFFIIPFLSLIFLFLTTFLPFLSLLFLLFVLLFLLPQLLKFLVLLSASQPLKEPLVLYATLSYGYDYPRTFPTCA